MCIVDTQTHTYVQYRATCNYFDWNDMKCNLSKFLLRRAPSQQGWPQAARAQPPRPLDTFPRAHRDPWESAHLLCFVDMKRSHREVGPRPRESTGDKAVHECWWLAGAGGWWHLQQGESNFLLEWSIELKNKTEQNSVTWRLLTRWEISNFRSLNDHT